MDIVGRTIRNARLTISILIFLIVSGAMAYVSIPKEAEPDIQIPIIYVQLGYQGISPEDSERLLLRPMEARVKSIAGIKKMTSTAFQGGGNVLVEFQAGTDLSKALDDMRSAVDDAKRDLPQGADEPSVHEVNLSEFPVLVLTLSGNLSERVLGQTARELADAIRENVPGVLNANLQGVRDEMVEVVIDPGKLSAYGLRIEQLVQAVGAGNSLIAAGSIEGDQGNYAVKVPALIETVADTADLPIVAGPNATVLARDIADIRSTFADTTSITRLDGQPAVAIEISKRTGANLIETVDGVKAVVASAQSRLPTGSVVTYSQDKSVTIRQLLSDLQNSVLTAVILVFIVILFALSGRASLLIGMAIPTSFLIGILILSFAGLTVNLVVLFSLILAVGMLVDDAIIVTEFAERRMAEGMDRVTAFRLAANRMSGPVIAATMTRVAAFSPLLFWPGIVGEFMKYLPITLIATLSASLLYALVFTPTLGAVFGRAATPEEPAPDGLYMWFVQRAVRHPVVVLFTAVSMIVAVPVAYGTFGKGVEFFPDVEPDYGLLYVHARGNLSTDEKDALVREAEGLLIGRPGIKSVYTRVGGSGGGAANQNVAADVVGTIQYEFIDWRERKQANDILSDLRAAMTGIPGARIEVSVPEAGPSTGKAIQVQLSADQPDGLNDTAREVAGTLGGIAEVIDVSDGLPPPGVDWELRIDRAEAARYGIGPNAVGTMVQLVTGGVKLTDYRPAGSDDAVDIRLRLPEDMRTLAMLDQLRIETPLGAIPVSNVVTRGAVPATGTLTRIDGARTVTVSAGIAAGIQADAVRQVVTERLDSMNLDVQGVRWQLAGEDEEQKAAGEFLTRAFIAALFLIFIVLLAQFNRFISVGLVLIAVVMSTIGVFLGLMIMGQPFGVVMSGIGVIALAGIVVNNNIVLIDTYDHLRREGMDKLDAILQTCRERARPVVLTALTAILGVLPIAFGFNLEILSHETTYGAPSTQWWISLSGAIVFGLAFSTVLTLIVTPSMLMLVTQENAPSGPGILGRLRGMWKRLLPAARGIG